ncbi:hypothetical protein L873DRAFT_1760460 [Choiromyces venosus 120613-1]|uniref:PH domain-containing protein n=1 Tax=Choiromyces venosus 120613-1 TaxID=1336337 RepID=A0A3N4K315_9PEZI|nr:hypothetical protein L873DRAFT_1760460 [Choiromyces venosus 120613-1]
MMETEKPHPLPSRYRTIRGKLGNHSSNSQTPAAPAPTPQQQPQQQSQPRFMAAPLINSIESPKPVVEPPLARNPSKFRKILRLNTKDVPPAPVPLIPSTETTPHGRKLVKTSHSPEKTTSRFGRRRGKSSGALGESSAEEEAGNSARREKNIAQSYDIKVPVNFSRGKEPVGILNSTDVESFLSHVRPGKQRIVVESWPIFGLQRQVRYFEKLSDVHQTWEIETKCHFRVEKNVWGQTSERLENYAVEEPSSGIAQFHYYVQADKKWSKRWIKLDGGAVKISKKDKPRDKDFTQTINLDSFDIYSFVSAFSPENKLKCPTKYCFALKSQHKMSLFGKDSVYCHYFSAESPAQLSQWFTMIRDSKSRLIAEKLSIAPWTVEPEIKEEPSSSHKSISSGSLGDRRRPKPLISLEELAQPASEIQRSKSLHRARSTKKPRGRERSATGKSPQIGGSVSDGDAVFSPGGLLGSDYEDKKRVAQLNYKEERAKPHNEFSSLMTPQTPKARNFSPRDLTQPLVCLETSPKETQSLRRRETVASRPSTSHKQGGTLLNFDAEEPVPSLPHRHRGGGHTVSEKDARGNGGLISFAKSSLETPPLPNAPPMFAQQLKRPQTAKSRTRHCEASGDEDQTPFTGTGLLAGGRYQSAGAGMAGHGVATSKDAIGKNGEITPLLNPYNKSVFVPGSLLEKREKEMGPTRPIIDRDYHLSDSDS